jgi:hypothetical protein
MGRFKVSQWDYLTKKSGLPLKGINMFMFIIMVLVAIFAIVAAVVNKEAIKQLATAALHGFHVDTFVVGPYHEYWWENCRKVTALLHGERVTIKGCSWGTTGTGNFLFESDGITYTLYGHHLLVESVWN